MKRSEALAPLSRDHHHALVVARDLIRATEENAPAAAQRFVGFLAQHELAHFAIEESVLLPVVPEEDPGRQLARRMLEDHAFLRDAMRRLDQPDATTDIASVHAIGRRLRDHVQMEEREFFPYLEGSLSASMLDEIGARVQAAGEGAG